MLFFCYEIFFLSAQAMREGSREADAMKLFWSFFSSTRCLLARVVAKLAISTNLRQNRASMDRLNRFEKLRFQVLWTCLVSQHEFLSSSLGLPGRQWTVNSEQWTEKELWTINSIHQALVIYLSIRLEQVNRPFPSSLVPLFRNESKCETFHMKMSSARSFVFMQIKVIFIRIVLHLDSLWNRGTRKLGNGLLFAHPGVKR